MPSFLSRIIDSFGGYSPDEAAASTKALTIQGFGINQEYYAGDLAPRFHAYPANGGTPDVGDLWANSAVAACIGWIARTIVEAPITVRTKGKKGSQKTVDGHPLAVLLQRPNKYFSGDLLLQGVVLSLVASGNAYLHIVRGAQTQAPVELWYIPHFNVRPLGGGDFITGYEVTVNGQKTTIPEADIIHLRDGIDPRNQLLGLSPLASCIREVASDNQANAYTAAILRNMGVPGVVISPVEKDDRIDPADAELIKSKWGERVSGENRGMPLVMPTPMVLTTYGHSPEDMALDKIRDVPESRITACIGIPAMVVGLSSGAATKTYANLTEAKASAWEECLIPLLRRISGELDVQLLPFLGDPSTQQVWFDLSEVVALQDDKDQAVVRASTLYDTNLATLGEARQMAGLTDKTPDDAKFAREIAAEAAAALPPPPIAPPPVPVFKETGNRIP